MIHTHKIVGHIFGTNVGIHIRLLHMIHMVHDTYDTHHTYSQTSWSHFWDKLWKIRTYICYTVGKGEHALTNKLVRGTPRQLSVAYAARYTTTCDSTLDILRACAHQVPRWAFEPCVHLYSCWLSDIGVKKNSTKEEHPPVTTYNRTLSVFVTLTAYTHFLR